jgi:ubiquinone/menaquinone biosynthesis C-methylase UbiE
MTHELLATTFDQWAAEGRDAAMENEHGDAVRQVVAQMGIQSGDQILDLGCGNGWATRLLAKTTSGVGAVGVDVSPAMIGQAEELHSYTIRARYELCPIEKLDFNDGQFHRVFSMETLYYAVDLEVALAEMLRVLKPGGTADIVIDYYKENEGTTSWAKATGVPMHYLGEAEWKAAFEAAGFGDVAVQRVRDSRGAGDAESFEPSCCYPDFATWQKVRDAGSLWIHAEKPA